MDEARLRDIGLDGELRGRVCEGLPGIVLDLEEQEEREVGGDGNGGLVSGGGREDGVDEEEGGEEEGGGEGEGAEGEAEGA